MALHEHTIAFDARMVHCSGIGTYIRGLAGAMADFAAGDRPAFVFQGDPAELGAYPCFGGLGRIARSTAPIYGIRGQMLYPRVEGASLYHFPHYNVPRLLRAPYVVTVHDLIHQLFPEVLGSRFKLLVSRAMLGHAVKHAERIITVSGYTRRDIARHCGVPEERIAVTYNAVSPSFQRAPDDAVARLREELGLPGRFLLAVGVNRPHKNFPFLIDAFAQWVSRRGADAGLVICGMQGRDAAQLGRLAAERNVAKAVRFIDYLEHGKLPALYQAADALVFPSLYEGFGIPVIEAQRLGTPVISSSASCMPEVAGEGALYFDPRSPAEFGARLDDLYADPGNVARLVERGYSNERRFSWQAAARGTLEVYAGALSSG